MSIRAVRPSEFPVLQDIEVAAGECFRGIGMPEIADDEPFPLDVLARYHDAGHAWVSTDEEDAPAAYLLADEVDGDLHVEQVSVHPRLARRGLGRGLIEHVAGYARATGRPALTLTTFVDVPWNAPYYARCGFVVMADDEIGPGLLAVRRHEADLGLDRWPRVCLRRPV